jgi:hypothetical protein
MPLGEPPEAGGSLADWPHVPLADRLLHRVWRHHDGSGAERSLWWFAAVTEDPQDGGRFDLPAPMGTCYTATSPAAAVLEALQGRLRNLPRRELAARRRAEVVAGADAPAGADTTARDLVGRFGVTAELWAGRDRALTQRWAAALRRDGWWALHTGIAHDPSGTLRGVALFDRQGGHPPSYGRDWEVAVATLHDDEALHAELETFGVTVRQIGDLPFADPRHDL